MLTLIFLEWSHGTRYNLIFEVAQFASISSMMIFSKLFDFLLVIKESHETNSSGQYSIAMSLLDICDLSSNQLKIKLKYIHGEMNSP
jgi:hypothetical protein